MHPQFQKPAAIAGKRAATAEGARRGGAAFLRGARSGGRTEPGKTEEDDRDENKLDRRRIDIEGIVRVAGSGPWRHSLRNREETAIERSCQYPALDE